MIYLVNWVAAVLLAHIAVILGLRRGVVRIVGRRIRLRRVLWRGRGRGRIRARRRRRLRSIIVAIEMSHRLRCCGDDQTSNGVDEQRRETRKHDRKQD